MILKKIKKCGELVNDILEIQFNNGLVPAIVQEYITGKVLMLAYMNEESFKKTIETGTTWFFSRSRNKLWNKGETSGHFQYVKNISIDCDGDTILIIVEQIGVACHTGSKTCFYREIWNSKVYIGRNNIKNKDVKISREGE
ncbi:phosphoribosyl-AMP cyclohydrolase [Clostridium tagluense]|nr:phosphoribosyl-AMP cyclohydrolase [Clostridium tagluense]WLC67692.1 phosphoribosyl-AMP cyclohydrolase [Clostridium tagluense]